MIVLEVDRIADSCGFAVPVYEYRARADSTDRLELARRDPRAWKSTRRRRTARASTGSTGCVGSETG